MITLKNPIKTTTINYSIEKVKEALNFIDKSSPNFIFKESNEVLNSFKFSNRDGISLLGEGNILDVNLDSVNENKTAIQIEGSTLLGGLNSTELMMLKSGIEDLLDILSKLITSDNIKETANELSKTIKKTKSFYNYAATFIKWSLIWSLIAVGMMVVYAFVMVGLGLDPLTGLPEVAEVVS
jgi:hypothetical protein